MCTRFVRSCAPCADVATNALGIYNARSFLDPSRACVHACVRTYVCMCPYATLKRRGTKVLLVSCSNKPREDNSGRRDALGMFFPHSGKGRQTHTHIHIYICTHMYTHTWVNCFRKGVPDESIEMSAWGARVSGWEGKGKREEGRTNRGGQADGRA